MNRKRASGVFLGVLSAMAAGCSSGDVSTLGSAPNTSTVGSLTFEAGNCGANRCGASDRCVQDRCVPDPCFGAGDLRSPLGEVSVYVNAAQISALFDDGAQTLVDYSINISPVGSKFALPAAASLTSGPVYFKNAISAVIGDTANKALKIKTPGAPDTNLTLPIVPTWIGSGDVDGLGTHELFIADGKQLVICDLPSKKCDPLPLPSVTHSLTVEDVDGDTFADAVLLADHALLVYSGKSKSIVSVATEKSYSALASARIVDTDRATLALASAEGIDIARLRASTDPKPGLEVLQTIEGGANAVAFGPAGDDRKSQMMLGAARGAELTLYSLESGTFVSKGSQMLAAPPRDLVSVDLVNRSIVGVMTNAERTPGRIVPTHVLVYAPHWEGLQSPGTTRVGDESETTRGEGEKLSVAVGTALGVEDTLKVGGGLKLKGFFGLAEVEAEAGYHNKLATKVSNDVTNSDSSGQTRRLSARSEFSIEFNRERDGVDEGAVQVIGSCFDRFEYQLHDGTKVLEGGAGRIAIGVPVRGREELMGITRYNAMAEVTGSPVIRIPIVVGNPKTYPDKAVDLGNTPVATEKFIFEPSIVYSVSDRAITRWRRDIKDETTRTVADGTKTASSTSFTEGYYVKWKAVKSIFYTAGEVTRGVTSEEHSSSASERNYTVSIGARALYSGTVQPIADDPNTPEDEFSLFRYSFAPYVYKESVKNATGEQFEFYVTNYIVAGIER